MKKYYLIFLSLLFIFPISVFAEEEKSNELISNAVSGLLIEQSTGEILFEKDKDKQVPIASMTKMVAQTIILEQIEAGKIKWDNIVEVSKNAADMGGSQIYLTAGEKMSVRDLFKGYEWNRISRSDRLLLGTLFLNYVHNTSRDWFQLKKLPLVNKDIK